VAALTRKEREQIAERRIVSVIRTQGVANLRTLEHKIADAGPNPQRVQPHILTPVKAALVKSGRLIQLNQNLQSEFSNRTVVRRTGQALEIAIFRALVAADGVTPLGGFSDLEEHDDEQLYSKEETRNLNGLSLGKRALDFIAVIGGDFCGIEAKNVRPWLYPNDHQIREAVAKARTLGVVPVIIARRIPFVTFRVLGTCGVILHETYNQRMANADAQIAARARHKDQLGYHDIRVGNEPDARLTRFVGTNLPNLVASAKAKLGDYGDLLDAFANGMEYREFAARARRRQLGQNEDHDWKEVADDEDRDPLDD
jgi:hypothetical protein